jgi:tryptophanase
MKKIKYILLPTLAISILAGSAAYAMAEINERPNSVSFLAEAIATKFNLPVADVQSVIGDTMIANRAQMGKNRPGRVDVLARAVADGKLTQAQSDLIAAKREELKNSVDTTKVLSVEERKELMKKHQAELKQWATNNNIPEQYVMGFGGGMRNGEGAHFGRGGGSPNMQNQ